MITKERLECILTEKQVNPEVIDFILSGLYKEEKDSAWNWIKKEYTELFVEIGKERHLKESIVRMKKFFSENPDVRKDEVIGATILYIRTTDSRFVRLPHYFISKGVGSEKTSDLFTWIEKYRELNKAEEGQRDLSRNLQ